MATHSTAHFNATSDYLAKHCKRARREGALSRLEMTLINFVALGHPATDFPRLTGEIATLKGRLGR